MKPRFPLYSDHLILMPDNEHDIWNEKWTVSLHNSSSDRIGILRFSESKVAGETEVYVELDPAYRDKGYGEEIFYFMAKFAFRFRRIKEICAVCAHDNDKCIHALEKADYVLREHKNGMDYYSKKKPKTAWAGLYIPIGLIAGYLLGILISNLIIGTIIGVSVGVFVGFVLDKKLYD